MHKCQHIKIRGEINNQNVVSIPELEEAFSKNRVIETMWLKGRKKDIASNYPKMQ